MALLILRGKSSYTSS